MKTLSQIKGPVQGTVPLVSSKSESNRVLILQALAGKDLVKLHNLSAARDTVTLQRLLEEKGDVLDARDAGTTMRFLTAFCAASGRPALLTGTPRMQERPIGILLDALRQLGADIVCEGKDGFPPHRIRGFEQLTRSVAVRGDVSSQYISALLMIGPFLPMGLELTLLGEVASLPYIRMTIALMQQFGLVVDEDGPRFCVAPQQATASSYTVESDWSGAGYWYSLLALAREGELKLMHLREESLQGDRQLVPLMEELGVQTQFEADGIRLRKGKVCERFEADFSDIPDQAQTFAVLCAALGVPSTLSGLKSLRIKETDRIAALEAELAQFGCEVEVEGDDVMRIPAGGVRVEGQEVATYDDHRMAMAFAPLAALGNLRIQDPGVVEKSYPSFWSDFRAVTAGS